MLPWRNIREGTRYLLISDDGRFAIQRLEVSGSPFVYEVVDSFGGQTATVPTLQEARRKALEWAT